VTVAYNTELILVVDESGSMICSRLETIQGINELVQEQRRLPGQLAITLVTFNRYMKPRRTRIKAEDFEYLTPADYEPHGMTALVDAVCHVLDTAEKWTVPQGTDRIVAIVTDGKDNVSQFDPLTAKARIERLEGQGWKFIYLGSGIDAINLGASIGTRPIAVDLVSAQGVRGAYLQASSAVTSLRAQP